jgi:hypothetical protein
MTRIAKLLFITTALVAAPAVHAQTAIQSFTGGTIFPGFGTDETVGFVFDANANLSVTSLGWYAQDGSLATAHQVGIWNSSGTLLGNATVAADVVAGSVGFRYQAVTPFALISGQRYYIGGRDAIQDGDSYVTSVSNLVTAPQITYRGSAVSAQGSGFAFPDSVNNTTTGGRFGANFQFVASSVPEPASWAMMIGGMGVVGGAMRRRRKVQTTVRFA